MGGKPSRAKLVSAPLKPEPSILSESPALPLSSHRNRDSTHSGSRTSKVSRGLLPAHEPFTDSYILPVSAGPRIQEVPKYPLVSHGKMEKQNSNSVLGENSKSASSSIRTSSSSTGRPSSVRFSSMLQNNVRIGSSSNGPKDRVVYPGSIVAFKASFSDDAFDVLPEEFGAPTSDLCSKGQEDHRDVDVRPDAFLNPIPDNIHGSRILGGSETLRMTSELAELAQFAEARRRSQRDRQISSSFHGIDNVNGHTSDSEPLSRKPSVETINSDPCAFSLSKKLKRPDTSDIRSSISSSYDSSVQESFGMLSSSKHTESSGVKLGSLKVSFHSANVPDPEMCTSLSDHHLHPLSLSSEKLSSNDSMSSKDITTIPIQDPFLESYDHVQFIRQESDEESILSQDDYPNNMASSEIEPEESYTASSSKLDLMHVLFPGEEKRNEESHSDSDTGQENRCHEPYHPASKPVTGILKTPSLRRWSRPSFRKEKFGKSEAKNSVRFSDCLTVNLFQTDSRPMVSHVKRVLVPTSFPLEVLQDQLSAFSETDHDELQRIRSEQKKIFQSKKSSSESATSSVPNAISEPSPVTGEKMEEEVIASVLAYLAEQEGSNEIVGSEMDTPLNMEQFLGIPGHAHRRSTSIDMQKRDAATERAAFGKVRIQPRSMPSSHQAQFRKPRKKNF